MVSLSPPSVIHVWFEVFYRMTVNGDNAWQKQLTCKQGISYVTSLRQCCSSATQCNLNCYGMTSALIFVMIYIFASPEWDTRISQMKTSSIMVFTYSREYWNNQVDILLNFQPCLHHSRTGAISLETMRLLSICMIARQKGLTSTNSCLC